MRLRTVSCQGPGWTRARHGRGFRYLDEHGEPLAPADRERVRELVIPPAWTEVWICPHPRGHLQAVGTDEAGRRQYLYHPAWREQRDLEKFERVTELAGKLPGLRRKLRNRLRAEPGDGEAERTRELAAAVRLIDLGCFRPGSDAAAEEFGSHGLTTLERRHVRQEDGALVFRDAGYVWRPGRGLRVPLPLHLLLGRAYVEERPVPNDAGAFTMQMRIRHPWWGDVFRYSGRFRLD